MPTLSMFFGLIVYMYAKDDQGHYTPCKSMDNHQSGRPYGKLEFGNEGKHVI